MRMSRRRSSNLVESQSVKSQDKQPEKGETTWPHGQAVKTSPFHGGNTGSIPVGVTFN